jgi:vacuolar protein sorting-associated protein 13A/C
MALTINRLGMSLMRMGQEESVRFLDEIDLTFSLDSRKSSQEHMTSIELAIKPIVFRASYRDIDLITTIVNRAIELYSKTAPTSGPDATIAESSKRKQLPESKFTTGKSVRSQSQPVVGQARALMSKEQAR